MSSDMMGLTEVIDGQVQVNGAQLGLMNAAAFAPVPIMLLIMNAITKKRNIYAALKVGFGHICHCYEHICALRGSGWGIKMFDGSLFYV